MSDGFPPTPVYPDSLDSDFTLFLVYNTTETVTVADVDAYGEEIPIRPQGSNKPEKFADNGFATIAGELFYYDSVDKNSDGRVCRLKRCLRNLGGRPTQFNEAGTWVRGFVVAEHHNQLVDCTLLAENFIGENFSTNPATLDWRIRHLAQSPIQSDDYCPEVEFDFNIVSTSPITGTIATYNVTINGGGTMTLQFGDGGFTQVVGSGTHVYAPGANIDPVVIVNTDLCQIVQSPINRVNPNTPVPTALQPPFVVPVPIPPPIPPIVIPSIVIPPPTINIPPVVFPCLTPGGLPSVIMISPPLNIPSQIAITPINIPSQITITPVNIPSQININVPSNITSDIPPNITISPPPSMPPIQVQPPQIPPIMVQPAQISGPDIPSIIKIDAPSTIGFAGPSSITIQGLSIPSVIMLEGLRAPELISVIGGGIQELVSTVKGGISVVGFPSIIPVDVTINQGKGLSLIHNLPEVLKLEPLQFGSLPKLRFDEESMQNVMTAFGEQFAEVVRVNMPNFSEIKFPDLKVDWGDATVKAVLKLRKPASRKGMMMREEVRYEELDFPGEFKLVAPEIPPMKVKVRHDIPSAIAVNAPRFKDIKIDASAVPAEIRLLPPKENLTISVMPFSMPKVQIDTAALEGLSIPVKMPDEMPMINVAFPEIIPNIKVEFPSQIPTIKVEVPDNTRIPLIYDGPPIPVEPVQVSLKIQNLAGEAADNIQCFALVPCNSKS